MLRSLFQFKLTLNIELSEPVLFYSKFGLKNGVIVYCFHVEINSYHCYVVVEMVGYSNNCCGFFECFGHIYDSYNANYFCSRNSFSLIFIFFSSKFITAFEKYNNIYSYFIEIFSK